MTTENIEFLYKRLNDSTEILQAELECSYLEGLIENGENILDKQTVRVIEGKPSPEATQKLQKIYKNLNLEDYSSEEMRKAFQMMLLQAVKTDYIQPNHQLTPDTIGFILVYLLRIFLPEDTQEVHLLNLGVGTGNLLTTVLNQLEEDNIIVTADGIDNDDVQAALAVVNTRLQGHSNVEIYLQDVMTDLYVEPADIVMSDLPIGYYPVDERAADFQSSFEEGHSFAHYLMIEQGLYYLKENGFAFYIIPSRLFEEETSKILIDAINEEAYVQAVLQLPDGFFSNEESRKAILAIQRKGDRARQVKEVLFAKVPDFNNKETVQSFMADINKWKQDNIR